MAAALVIAIASAHSAGAADQFSFTAERMEIVLAQGRERTVLAGAAELVSDDTVIKAERIGVFGDDFTMHDLVQSRELPLKHAMKCSQGRLVHLLAIIVRERRN